MSELKEAYVIQPKENRQAQIEALALGESIAVAKRIDIQHGFPEGAIQVHSDRMRGTLDQQVYRARRRYTERRWTTETGYFLSRSGALIITAACTRTE